MNTCRFSWRRWMLLQRTHDNVFTKFRIQVILLDGVLFAILNIVWQLTGFIEDNSRVIMMAVTAVVPITFINGMTTKGTQYQRMPVDYALLPASALEKTLSQIWSYAVMASLLTVAVYTIVDTIIAVVLKWPFLWQEMGKVELGSIFVIITVFIMVVLFRRGVPGGDRRSRVLSWVLVGVAFVVVGVGILLWSTVSVWLLWLCWALAMLLLGAGCYYKHSHLEQYI